MKTFFIPERRTFLLRVFSILAAAAISIWVYRFQNQTNELKALGDPGIFLISLMAKTTVLLPAPGVAVVFAMCSFSTFNHLSVGFIAGLSSGLGELAG